MDPESVLEETIIAAAAGLKSATADGQTAEAHSLADLVAADKHLTGTTAVNLPHRGLRFNKLIPPGAD